MPVTILLTSTTVDALLIDISLIALLLFGVLHLSLGLLWNTQRFRLTFKYSPKYRAVWLIGLLEVIVVMILVALRFF
jgi:hypothetical protein